MPLVAVKAPNTAGSVGILERCSPLRVAQASEERKRQESPLSAAPPRTRPAGPRVIPARGERSRWFCSSCLTSSEVHEPLPPGGATIPGIRFSEGEAERWAGSGSAPKGLCERLCSQAAHLAEGERRSPDRRARDRPRDAYRPIRSDDYPAASSQDERGGAAGDRPQDEGLLGQAEGREAGDEVGLMRERPLWPEGVDPRELTVQCL